MEDKPKTHKEASERAFDLKCDANAGDGRGFTDTRGAAVYTGMSKTWLEKARHYGSGPPYLKVGAAVRYSYAALDAWMAQQVRTCTREAAA